MPFNSWLLYFALWPLSDQVIWLYNSRCIVLNAIIIQEFIHIYNTEREMEKNDDKFMNDPYRYWRLAGIVMLELFVIATVYYLSTIMVVSLQRLWNIID